jgi:hypothetical protein
MDRSVLTIFRRSRVIIISIATPASSIKNIPALGCSRAVFRAFPVSKGSKGSLGSKGILGRRGPLARLGLKVLPGLSG